MVPVCGFAATSRVFNSAPSEYEMILSQSEALFL
jgi:hypothetical protein